jgi:hypothetical protein
MVYNCVYYCMCIYMLHTLCMYGCRKTYSESSSASCVSQLLVTNSCIEYIGVVSVHMQYKCVYNCVYYCMCIYRPAGRGTSPAAAGGAGGQKAAPCVSYI